MQSQKRLTNDKAEETEPRGQTLDHRVIKSGIQFWSHFVTEGNQGE